MQENSRYGVGLDIGTTTIRCVVGHIDGTGAPTIIGVAETPSNGMRKGTVAEIVAVAQSVDKALELAERMSGHQVHQAAVSINGTHISGMSSKGVIAITAGSHEVDEHDLTRAEEAATVLQLPANREILQVTPRSYQLDGQTNIKDPIGMSGVRLEVDAYVITALTPHLKNLEKACEMSQTSITQALPAGLAAARAGLTDAFRENGVVLVDIGGATTSVAVFDEGDLQHVAILPIGSDNITKDLAICLRTELSVAEEIKLKHATAQKRESKTIEVTHNKESISFETADIDDIVDARLEELFELVNAELTKVGRASKLPAGAVISGGGANLSGIAEYAKEALQLPARLVSPLGLNGVSDAVKNPAFTTALGLMMLDLEGPQSMSHGAQHRGSGGAGSALGGATKFISNLLGRFKS
jgi:cell division protein FtsA